MTTPNEIKLQHWNFINRNNIDRGIAPNEEFLDKLWNGQIAFLEYKGVCQAIQEEAKRQAAIAIRRGDYDDSINMVKLRSRKYPHIYTMMWVTINPPADVDFGLFKKAMFSFFNSGPIVTAMWNFEQNGTCDGKLGNHPHVHAIVCQKILHGCEWVKFAKRKLGHIINFNDPQCLIHWFKYQRHEIKDHPNRVKYLHGDKKSDSKCELSKFDRKWRESKNLKDIYSKGTFPGIFALTDEHSEHSPAKSALSELSNKGGPKALDNEWLGGDMDFSDETSYMSE